MEQSSSAASCPTCGRQLGGAARFCAGCGAPVAPPVATAQPAPWAASRTPGEPAGSGAPGPDAPGRGRARWAAALAGALLAAAALTWYVLAGPGSSDDGPAAAGTSASSSSSSTSSASSASAATPRSTRQDGPLSPQDLSPAEQLAVVQELEDRRAQAFAEQDPELLLGYYADEAVAVSDAEGFAPGALVEVVSVSVNDVDETQILANVATREPGSTGPDDQSRIVVAYAQVQVAGGGWEWRAVDFYSNE